MIQALDKTRLISLVAWLATAAEGMAFGGPLLLSEFDGAGSNRQCVSGDTTGDGKLAVFDCGQAIYMRTAIPGPDILLVSKTSGGSVPNGASLFPTFNLSGSQVLYFSTANNIVPGDNNDSPFFSHLMGGDVFLYNRDTDATNRIAFDRFGSEVPYPGVSYVAASMDFNHILLSARSNMGFDDDSNGEWDPFYLDFSSGALEPIAIGIDGIVGSSGSGALGLSDDGNRVIINSTNNNLVDGDNNGREDVFVLDRRSGTFDVVVKRYDGEWLTPADGQFVDFGRLRGSSRFLAYSFVGGGLVSGVVSSDPQIYLTNLDSGQNILVSIALGGGPGNGGSYLPQVSADGGVVTFSSDATDLVRNDTNGFTDVFVRDQRRGRTLVASATAEGELGNAQSGGEARGRRLSLSSTGRFLQLPSEATNFAPGVDTNGQYQVYLVDVEALFGVGSGVGNATPIPVPMVTPTISALLASLLCVFGLAAIRMRRES